MNGYIYQILSTGLPIVLSIFLRVIYLIIILKKSVYDDVRNTIKKITIDYQVIDNNSFDRFKIYSSAFEYQLVNLNMHLKNPDQKKSIKSLKKMIKKIIQLKEKLDQYEIDSNEYFHYSKVLESKIYKFCNGVHSILTDLEKELYRKSFNYFNLL